MARPPVPDLIQAVLGYRTWALDAEGWLLPFSLGAVAGPWRPGVNHATCHYAKWSGGKPGRPHAAPHPRCMCGLYALLDRSDQRLPHADATLALGAVGAWGDIELHRSGFRAQYATVLALAVPRTAPAHLRRRHERAAERYGVELVTPELLEAFGSRHAAPVPESLLPGSRGPSPHGPARASGSPPSAGGSGIVRGLRPEDHVWLEVPSFRCGITDELAARLAPGPIDLALPAVGTRHRTSDALAHVTGADGETLRIWPPLGARVREVNPALADDPGLLLRDPGGAGWLAALAPTDWNGESSGIEWGPAAARAYRVALAAPDPWSELRATSLRVHSGLEVLAELRRRRALPRFPDAAAVHEQLTAPLAAALAAAPGARRGLGRLGLRVAFALHEPDARFVLDARSAQGAVVEVDGPPGREAEVTFGLSAVDAERLLARRLDIARALRAGTVVADVPLARALAVSSVLTQLPVLDSRPVEQWVSGT